MYHTGLPVITLLQEALNLAVTSSKPSQSSIRTRKAKGSDLVRSEPSVPRDFDVVRLALRGCGDATRRGGPRLGLGVPLVAMALADGDLW